MKRKVGHRKKKDGSMFSIMRSTRNGGDSTPKNIGLMNQWGGGSWGKGWAGARV